jgi:hypothetical protein
MTTTTTDERLRAAVLALSEALDPLHQAGCWPDPIAWDGRPLEEQAHDLVALAGARIEDFDVGPITRAAVEVRRALRAVLAGGAS